MANMGQWDGVCDADAAFVFLFEDNVWRILVYANTEAFEFILDDSFVRKRFVDVEDNEDEMAGLGNSNDLTTSTFTILGSLNNTGEIEHLDSCAVVLDLARYGS